MRLTTVSVQRPDGTTLTTGIGVQIDQASLHMRVLHAQLGDYHVADLYKVITQWWPVFKDANGTVTQLQRGDLLVDERATNPETGANYQYRVSGLPKLFDLDHVEAEVEVATGT